MQRILYDYKDKDASFYPILKYCSSLILKSEGNSMVDCFWSIYCSNDKTHIYYQVTKTTHHCKDADLKRGFGFGATSL